VGVRVAIDQAARGITGPPGVPPLVFLVVPLMDMVVFVILLGAALWYRRRRPENHKRLMALTALNFLPPAVSRIPLAFIQSGGPPARLCMHRRGGRSAARRGGCDSRPGQSPRCRRCHTAVTLRSPHCNPSLPDCPRSWA